MIRVQESYRFGIALKPDFAKSNYDSGILLYGIGKYERGSIPFQGNSERKNQRHSFNFFPNLDAHICLYKQLDLLENNGKRGPVIGSPTMRFGTRYGVGEPNV